ncbi:MAG: maltose alpha-D-glucosyltransferase, partial [Pseudomonadales bacterium]
MRGIGAGALATVSDPLWYQDAVIYQLHVKAFKDADGDGVGDFRGLTECLDYVADLGINALWLLPFYPSPMRDDGYDVADYRGIHPGYGTRSDFRRFVRQAHRRGIRIITELVINHTSDQHPWFQASRHAPRGSAKRNYYVWSDSDKRYAGTRIIFSDTETSNWAWDPVARQYYWHRFFSHQPDLNFDNPSVVKAVIRVMRFWLDLGVDGLRLDAIPYLCEREGSSNENLPETHAVLRHLRAVVDAHYEQRVLLAEANQWPEDVREYFGDGDECHMAYHFPLMPRMYMALAEEDRYPVVEILEQTPEIPGRCQWAIFLRNHDELTLEMVTDEERDYMYASYASDPRARINAGIRRRLAPLLDNDLERIKLLNSLLLSMPGAPIIYYGDEIGMGDNIFLGDRNAVRTPMQWSPERNAGFSRADPQQLYLPPVMDPVYGYDAVNVEAQSRHGYSLLNWTRRLIAVRKTSQAFGRGSLSLLAPGNRHVLAYLREYEDEVILCVANLSRTAQPVELDLARFRGMTPLEMLGRSVFPPVGDLPYLLTLSSHGFFWFRLTRQAEIPDWHVEALPRTDLVTLVLRDGWQTFFPERLPQAWRATAEGVARTFTTRALPGFLRTRNWLAEQHGAAGPWNIERRILWRTDAGSHLLLWVRHGDASPSAGVCFLAAAIAWGGDREPHVRERLPMALARVREHARVGVLYEAFRDADFCHALLAEMKRGSRLADAEGELQFSSTSFGREVLEALPADAAWQVLPGEKRTTVVELGQLLRLKVSRCGETLLQAEYDLSRFLTEQGQFHNFPRLVGAL